ncbi:hypothetical protein [Ruminococcus difficilis]|uniref:Uncharacterized protein n=1 Tax=Ruminococcus difficilis TaxID=2763069 RepID=A0A934TZA2_9FIRM|nr:hypothetical protein [Ruminococcus difficilis]MBK6087445.1 hypothetical protein [Ruminococcus difficilis]
MKYINRQNIRDLQRVTDVIFYGHYINLKRVSVSHHRSPKKLSIQKPTGFPTTVLRSLFSVLQKTINPKRVSVSHHR